MKKKEDRVQDTAKKPQNARQPAVARPVRAPREVGPITYPESLPVSERRHEIAQALRNHQVIIVSGETGSGKTTQLPKICLEAGTRQNPADRPHPARRLAATSVARRIAEELNTSLGELVGYQIRFNDRTGPDSAIKLMTDGILLSESQKDPLPASI